LGAASLVIVAVVIGFGSSSKLAWAYGVAVTGTMLVTTILTFFLLRYGWGYPLAVCIAATGFFALVDAAFFYVEPGPKSRREDGFRWPSARWYSR
jgi:KUP system potassium uptake protein